MVHLKVVHMNFLMERLTQYMKSHMVVQLCLYNR